MDEEPYRFVCYCFGYQAHTLADDVRRTGRSAIRESIVDACRRGLNDCANLNPSGRCCLGEVAKVVAAAGLDGGETAGGCVARASEDGTGGHAAERGHRNSRRALGAAVLAAVLSSACCWLPLAALLFGTSAAGLGTFFAAARWPLLVASAVALGLGFYFTYRRPRCAPGEACALPTARTRRLSRVNRVGLWGASLLVVGFGIFPEVSSALTETDRPASRALESEASGGAVVTYTLSGLSCAACVGHAREAILGVPGVKSVEVSFATSQALVEWRGAPDDRALGEAVASLGYRVTDRRSMP